MIYGIPDTRDRRRTLLRLLALLLTLLLSGCNPLGPEADAPAEPKTGDTTVLDSLSPWSIEE